MWNSSVNVTKSAVSYGFGHIYRKNPYWKSFNFLCSGQREPSTSCVAFLTQVLSLVPLSRAHNNELLNDGFQMVSFDLFNSPMIIKSSDH